MRLLPPGRPVLAFLALVLALALQALAAHAKEVTGQVTVASFRSVCIASAIAPSPCSLSSSRMLSIAVGGSSWWAMSANSSEVWLPTRRAGLARHLNPMRSGVGLYRRDVALAHGQA